MWRLKISTCRKPGRNQPPKTDLLLSLLLGSLLLSGCLQQTQKPAQSWLQRYQLSASNQQLTVCQNMGCSRTVTITLPDHQWRQIQQLFQPPARNASEERNRIATAIGAMEQAVGPLAHTAHDAGRNALFAPGPGHQLDCIAETGNSTQYLQLFYHQQLLRWHRPVHPAHRGPLQLTGPHFSAVIEELHSGEHWAVDSWFHTNGQPAVVVPLIQWRDGFSPRDS